MRPGCLTERKHHTHCSQSFVSPDWIPPGTFSKQPKTLPACPLFLSSSSFSWINPFKASFLLSKKHAPSDARVIDSCSCVFLHSTGGHNCLTRCRLQMFLKPRPQACGCTEYRNQTSTNTGLDTKPVTGYSQVCLTSVI